MLFTTSKYKWSDICLLAYNGSNKSLHLLAPLKGRIWFSIAVVGQWSISMFWNCRLFYCIVILDFICPVSPWWKLGLLGLWYSANTHVCTCLYAYKWIVWSRAHSFEVPLLARPSGHTGTIGWVVLFLMFWRISFVKIWRQNRNTDMASLVRPSYLRLQSLEK